MIRRGPTAPGRRGHRVLEQDGVSPEGEARGFLVIHPFLIALIPILHLLAGNPGQARFSDALIPMLISLGFTLVAFVVLRLVLKNSYAAGLIVSLFLVLFFLPGQLVDFLNEQLSPTSLMILLFAALCVILAAMGAFILVRFRSRLGKPTHKTYWKIAALSLAGIVCLISFTSLAIAYPLYFLFAAVCVILAAGVFILVKFKNRLQNPTRVLNVVAIVLMVFVLANLFTSGTHGNVTIRTNEVRRAAASKDVAYRNPADLPDVYYIILDSYGSERLLRDHFGFDNSKFIRSLEDRGFYVTDSRSNYNHTDMSLASSLNMTYINYLSPEVGERSTDMTPLRRMIEDNTLMRFLKPRGYKFAWFGTGFAVTRSNRYADIAYGEKWLSSEFMVTLRNSTVFRCFRPIAGVSRESVLNAFAEIPLTRKRVKGPLFLFAHIPPPHLPYLFDRNGKPLKPSDDMKANYLEQVMFVNKKVTEMVDEILSVSKRPPVIVIQGDHGPSLDKKHWDYAQTQNLNALLVPSGGNLFYRSMTPVNSFRVILNSIFGTHFSLLPDRTYASRMETPYAFKEITKTPLNEITPYRNAQ